MNIFKTFLHNFGSPTLYFTRKLMSSKKESVEPSETIELDSETVGDPLPVVFGTRYVTPKVAWWGDVKTTKISASSSGKKS